MKHLIAITSVLIGFLAAGRADQFQLKESKNGAKADVGYAVVKIVSANKTVFEGKTDKYGRITVPVSKGKYEAVVTTGTTKATTSLTVDGDKKLKQAVVK